MALVNDHLGAINEPNFTVNINSSGDLSSPENYGLDQEGAGVSASSSSTMNSDPGFVFYLSDQMPHDSLIDFNGSLLNFQQNEHGGITPPASAGYSVLEGNVNYSYNFMNQVDNTNPRVLENLNCFETTSSFGSLPNSTGKGHGHGDWLYSDATVVTTGTIQESVSTDPSTSLKRAQTGESMQASKKQFTGASGKAKPKTTSSSKDPQSLAAKNRRERISERLKILQELVPNGTKVDLVTMLEKAIGYVKFLQLQVKVLAADEFWPAQGGKAPDISQVKEAIEAILSSQRDSDV